jgi:hypothetical protein
MTRDLVLSLFDFLQFTGPEFPKVIKSVLVICVRKNPHRVDDTGVSARALPVHNVDGS